MKHSLQFALLGIVGLLIIITLWVLMGPWSFFLYILFGFFGWLYWKAAFPHVTEMEYGVVFDRVSDKFLFFVDEWGFFRDGEYIKRYKEDTYHHHLLPSQILKYRIPKGFITTSTTSEKLRTYDGVLVKIPWSVYTFFDPHNITPAAQFKLARALPNFAENILERNVRHALSHIVETKTVESLYQFQQNRGVKAQLEEELSKNVAQRIKPLGGTVSAVILHTIELPDEVEKALRGKYERAVQAQTLRDLDEAISGFDKNDLVRLQILEKLRLLEGSEKSVYILELLSSLSGFTNALKSDGQDSPQQ